MSSQYVGYGCWCGRHNNGIPVDETDQCCFEHDNCYDEADKKYSSGIFLESLPQSYFKTYDYICSEKHGVICRDDAESYSRKLCECDKAAASCFQRNRNSYNKVCFYSRKKIKQFFSISRNRASSTKIVFAPTLIAKKFKLKTSLVANERARMNSVAVPKRTITALIYAAVARF